MTLLLALLLGLALPAAWAQGVSPPQDKSPAAFTAAPWWDLSKAYACGRLLCSEVALPAVLSHFRGVDPMVLTIQPAPQASLGSQRALVEARSRTVRVGVDGIVQQLWRRRKRQPRAEEASSLLFWSITTTKPLHPDTPRVEVGVRNDQMVVFLAPNETEKLSQVTIVTVTEPDARHAGESMQELAERWGQTLRLVFSEALWGMDFNARYPLARQLLSLVILTLTGGVVLVGIQIYKRLRRLRHRLRRLLQTIQTSRREEANEAFTMSVATHADGPGSAGLGDSGGADGTPSRRTSRQGYSLATLERLLDRFIGNRDRFMAELNREPLLQPHRIRQALNLANLMARILLLAGLVSASVAGVGVFLIFPSTREAALFVALQSLAIPLLWMTLALAQPLLELAMDQVVNIWRTDAEVADPGSSRYGLRASTYSEMLKMLAGFLVVAVGLYGTILILGVDPSLLAGAGAIAIAIGFLARNLLEDMISGLMIILNDRFAIGDVIHVGEKSGLVEAINLHITLLRGGDGRLTSIPNRQINVVDNLTQNWSRVDFDVRIAAWIDGHRALEVIGATAHQMWQEPQWKDLIREEPAVLGVDEIGHDGTLIRVWIVTQPLKQWMVGREFRLRIQETLRREGIPLGMPQRLVHLPAGSALPAMPEA
ncbi:mechanosensitive ion channel domain-containing protein [Synechococcus sp. CCY 9618]|uniref:mechanosensitive ion channel family protein n=1 Tax=Synechococcus sp. CCY 9618 TaxID=2815602 RepID=UPI001C212C79